MTVQKRLITSVDLLTPKSRLDTFSYTERICYKIAEALFDMVAGSKPQAQMSALQKRAIQGLS
jgi:hypothetical protein